MQAMPPNARQLTQRLEAFLQVADVTQALTGPQASLLTASSVCLSACTVVSLQLSMQPLSNCALRLRAQHAARERAPALLHVQPLCSSHRWPTPHPVQAAGSLDLAAVLQHLHLLSQVVQAGGAPARTQPAQAAQEALQAQLGPAQAARDLPALARGLVKAVALLRAQAKFLRMDVANSRLAMLAHSMKDGAGLRQGPACNTSDLWLSWLVALAAGPRCTWCKAWQCILTTQW